MKLSNISRMTSAPLLLFLLMLLTGCGMQQKPLVEYRIIKQAQLPLSTELTSPIEAPPVPDYLTWGASVALNAQLYGVIGQCNIDRAGIRKIEQTRQGK